MPTYSRHVDPDEITQKEQIKQKPTKKEATLPTKPLAGVAATTVKKAPSEKTHKEDSHKKEARNA